jgi:hypothetical protein
MLYALTLTLCLLDGQCYDTMPESYTTLQECQSEAVHQIAQGLPKEFVSCKELEGIK